MHLPQKVFDIVWKYGRHLGTYSQHDTHQFYIAALDILSTHGTYKGSSDKSRSGITENAGNAPESPMSPVANRLSREDGVFNGDAPSSGQQTFNVVKSCMSGILQSDVVCSVYGKVRRRWRSFTMCRST